MKELQDIFEEEALDLVDLKKAQIPLIHRIFKEGRCLYARDFKTKIDFETQMESRYFDTETLRKEYFSTLRKRLENGSYGYR